MSETGQPFIPQEEAFKPDVEKAVERLIALSTRLDLANPVVSDIISKTEGISVEATGIQRRTVERLAIIDKEGTGVIVGKLQKLSSFLSELKKTGASNLSQVDFSGYKDADEMLYRHLQAGSERQIPSPLRDLIGQRKNKTGVESKVDKIIILCNDPAVVWTELLRQGVITQDYLDNFEEIMTFVEMSRKWEIVESASEKLSHAQMRALRAKVFSPYVAEKDVLVEEMVEGRFEMGKEFEKEMLTMFAHIAGMEKEKPSPQKGLTFRQMVVRTAASVAILAASATAMDDTLPKNESTPPLAAGQTETIGKEEQISEGHESLGDFISTENSGPESLKSGQKKVDWELKGSNLGGLYKTGDGWFFGKQPEGSNLGWYVSPITLRDEKKEVSNSQPPPQNSIEVSARFHPNVGQRGPVYTRLPYRYGYAINPVPSGEVVNGTDVTGSDNVTGDRETSSSITPGRWWENETGIRYNLVPAESSEISMTYDSPFSKYTTKFATSYMSLSDKDYERFEKIWLNINLSDLEKVKEFEKWIRNDFVYSLDRHYSDYYQKAKDPDKFIGRVFDKKHTDCDVANTALIFLIRNAGIPSRMAFGYNNDDSFLLNKDKNQLVRGEYHGWVEVFLDGKWVPFDATPVRPDEMTADILKESDIEGIPNPLKSKLPANLEELLLEMDSLGDLILPDFESPVSLKLPALLLIGGLIFDLYLFLTVVAWKRRSALMDKGEIVHGMARDILEKTTQAEYGDVKDFFDSYVKRKIADIEENSWRSSGHDLQMFVPILRRVLYRPYEEKYQGATERAGKVQDRLNSRNLEEELDPVDLFIEIGGYDKEKIYEQIRRRNLNIMLRDIVDNLNLGDFFLSTEQSGRNSDDQFDFLERAMTRGYRRKKIGKEIESSTLEKYVEKLVKRGCKAYRKEVRWRKNAKMKDPKKYGYLLDLTLTDKEVEEILRRKAVIPFVAMWYLINT